MKNVKFEILSENLERGKYYALAKITLDGISAYCLIVSDGEIAIESVGGEFGRAEEIYAIVASANVASIHLSDVISDMQNEIFA